MITVQSMVRMLQRVCSPSTTKNVHPDSCSILVDFVVFQLYHERLVDPGGVDVELETTNAALAKTRVRNHFQAATQLAKTAVRELSSCRLELQYQFPKASDSEHSLSETRSLVRTLSEIVQVQYWLLFDSAILIERKLF